MNLLARHALKEGKKKVCIKTRTKIEKCKCVVYEKINSNFVTCFPLLWYDFLFLHILFSRCNKSIMQTIKLFYTYWYGD